MQLPMSFHDLKYFCKSEEVAASTKILILWLLTEYNEFFEMHIGFTSGTYYAKLWPAAVAVDHILDQIEKMITGFTKMKKTLTDGTTKIVARPIRAALLKKFVTSTQIKKRLLKIPIEHKFPGNYLRSILIQVNLCQKLLFLHQLTHNMTTDCSWNYQFSTWTLGLYI